MLKPMTDMLMIGGLGFGMWVLYRISPEVGRTASVVLGAIFLLVLLSHLGRRWKERRVGE